MRCTMSLIDEVNNRRTFAIISHPDAGKTTLTEKLLLYGGAIHLAGSVKARKTAKHAVSDWMEIRFIFLIVCIYLIYSPIIRKMSRRI